MSKAPAVVRKRYRFMAVGCSHGRLINTSVAKQVLAFKKDFNPNFTAHLGDFIDTAAFRSGAKGTKDETESIPDDLNAGLRFLQQLEPNLVMIGNHENRLYKNMYHHNAILAHASTCMITDIRNVVAKLKATYIEDYNIRSPKSKYQLGDHRLMHGWMYPRNAISLHAERFGNCIIAHLHRVGSATGRRDDFPMGHCVGALADFDLLSYAHEREASLEWSHGVAYGEYCDNKTIVNLKVFHGED